MIHRPARKLRDRNLNNLNSKILKCEAGFLDLERPAPDDISAGGLLVSAPARPLPRSSMELRPRGWTSLGCVVHLKNLLLEGEARRGTPLSLNCQPTSLPTLFSTNQRSAFHSTNHIEFNASRSAADFLEYARSAPLSPRRTDRSRKNNLEEIGEASDVSSH